jgi:hypothetical protein
MVDVLVNLRQGFNREECVKKELVENFNPAVKSERNLWQSRCFQKGN